MEGLGTSQRIGGIPYCLPPTIAACIPADKTVLVPILHGQIAYAQALYIMISGAQQGRVIVEEPRGIEVFNNSQIDGILELGDSTLMRLRATTITFRGDGGEIVGTGEISPLVLGTLGGLSGGTTWVLSNQTNGSQSTGLTVHGHLSIQTPVYNGSYLIADADDREMIIQYIPAINSTGTIHGIWEARGSGILRILAEIRGAARWKLVDNEDAVISVEAPCWLKHSGPVEITRGTLKIDDRFITTGTLTMQSVSGSVAAIEVAAGIEVQFDN